jgi:hypothetical protein
MAHSTLAAHYEGKSAGEALAEGEAVWEQEMAPYQHGLLEEDPKRNPIQWAEHFVLYRQYYRKEPFVVRNVEVPFFLPLTDDLALGGIIDLVIEWMGQIMLVDHKTTSYINQKFIKSFNPNHQFSGYLLAANELIKPAKPITTLLINCLLTHPTESRPEKLFARPPTTRNLWQLAQVREQLISWWNNVVRVCRKTNSWPQDDHRCQDYSGCEYHPLCTSVDVDYRELEPSPAMYRYSEWDPIHQLRQHGLKEVGK